jgi:hypothetical protein
MSAVRFPAATEISAFASTSRHMHSVYLEDFSVGGKRAGVWSWLATSTYCWTLKCVELISARIIYCYGAKGFLSCDFKKCESLCYRDSLCA